MPRTRAPIRKLSLLVLLLAKSFRSFIFNDTIKYGDFSLEQKLQKQHAVLINISNKLAFYERHRQQIKMKCNKRENTNANRDTLNK